MRDFRPTHAVYVRGIEEVSDCELQPLGMSDFSLLCELECIIDLDAKITNSAFNPGVAQEQLHSANVLRPPIDHRRLCASQ